MFKSTGKIATALCFGACLIFPLQTVASDRLESLITSFSSIPIHPDSDSLLLSVRSPAVQRVGGNVGECGRGPLDLQVVFLNAQTGERLAKQMISLPVGGPASLLKLTVSKEDGEVFINGAGAGTTVSSSTYLHVGVDVAWPQGIRATHFRPVGRCPVPLSASVMVINKATKTIRACIPGAPIVYYVR